MRQLFVSSKPRPLISRRKLLTGAAALAAYNALPSDKAFAAGLSVPDGVKSVNADNSAASMAYSTYSTSVAGEIVIADAYIETYASIASGYPTASCAGSSLGTFNVAPGFPIQLGTFTNGGHTTWCLMYRFWAYAAGTLASETVTVSFATNAIDGAAGTLYGVSGFTGTTYHTNPWDSNSVFTSLNATNSASAPTVTGITTTNANCMLLAALGEANNGSPSTATGFTELAATAASGGSNYSGIDSAYLVVASSGAQSNVAWSSTFWGTIAVVQALSPTGGSAPTTTSNLLLLNVQ